MNDAGHKANEGSALSLRGPLLVVLLAIRLCSEPEPKLAAMNTAKIAKTNLEQHRIAPPGEFEWDVGIAVRRTSEGARARRDTGRVETLPVPLDAVTMPTRR